MRNKSVYSCSVKICASGFTELLESIVSILLVVEAFSLQKVVKMLEEVVFGWREVMNMLDEAELCSAVCATFETLIGDV